MYDRKWLELQIVRLGEKYPDRVGMRYALTDHRGDHCIVGQILHDHDACPCTPSHRAVPSRYYAMMGSPNARYRELWNAAVRLNNDGYAWGQIPKLLGLVPGEGKPEPLEQIELWLEQPEEEAVTC